MAKKKEEKSAKVMTMQGEPVKEKAISQDNPEMAEAPEKKELTDAEKALHQRRVILQRTGEVEELMKTVVEDMQKEGYQAYAYRPGSEVTLPGQMFAELINLISACAGHISNQRAVMNDMVVAGESLYLGAFNAQLELTKMHIKHCEEGITTSPEEMKKEDEAKAKEAAKANIKEVEKKPAKKKKATGSK